MKQEIIKYCEYYCKNINIKIVFLLFRAEAVISVKAPVPKFPRSFFVEMATFLICNASCIGGTTRQLTIRIKDQLKTEFKPHVSIHFKTNTDCKTFSCPECFEIIGSAMSQIETKRSDIHHL